MNIIKEETEYTKNSNKVEMDNRINKTKEMKDLDFQISDFWK